ncbi:MAG: glycosyltransferase family 2 protein [Candidatus Uhrbacteria bacterium]|nr:glycosyltransferase family 2 protein [Candidatus Uhrbacteria bacterium]
MKVIALIPAYNEERTIADVLTRTEPFVDGMIVVDDGSTDRTPQIARAHGAMVVSHVINRGLGAAIGTGFAAAMRLGADTVVTLDADGQHDPMEIKKFVEAIEQGADVVIGSRMLTGFEGMPLHRRAAQIIGNIVTFVLFGAWVTDSQSGFRAFTRWALEKIQIRTNRMEVSSELIAEANRNGLKLVEVPIKAVYTQYSLSKGQNFFVGLKTVLKLVVHRLSR